MGWLFIYLCAYSFTCTCFFVCLCATYQCLYLSIYSLMYPCMYACMYDLLVHYLYNPCICLNIYLCIQIISDWKSLNQLANKHNPPSTRLLLVAEDVVWLQHFQGPSPIFFENICFMGNVKQKSNFENQVVPRSRKLGQFGTGKNKGEDHLCRLMDIV